MEDPIAHEAFEYLNKLRQNPLLAVPVLEERLKNFSGKIYKQGSTHI